MKFVLNDDFSTLKSVYSALSMHGLVFANPRMKKAVLVETGYIDDEDHDSLHELDNTLHPRAWVAFYMVHPKDGDGFENGDWEIVTGSINESPEGEKVPDYFSSQPSAKDDMHKMLEMIEASGDDHIILSCWSYCH